MKPATIDEIDTAIGAYQTVLANDLTDNAVKAWIAGDMIGHKQLKIPINMSAVHQEALKFGKVHGKLLREEGATIIKGRKIPWLADSVQSTRADVVDIINKGIEDGLPMGDITGKKIVPDTVSYNLRETLVRNKDYEYVRIARTETASIQNKAAINRYEINGIKKVLVHDGHDFDAECAAADGQIWSTEYAMNHELEHPNCTRSFSPVLS